MACHETTHGPHVFATPADGADAVTLDADDARHLHRVLRVRKGDPVSVSDGRGSVWQATVASAGDAAVTVTLGERREVGRERPRLVVVHALPKQRKLDDVIQRLTELGVDEVRPVASERSQVELTAARAAKAVLRWRAVAYAAARQSRRAWLPLIADVGDWGRAFAAASCGVTLWEESTTPLRTVLEAWPACEDVVIGIGPEGGLTPGEVTASGLPDASLGPTVLRTETAALVAVSAIRYHLGLMSR